MLLEHADQVRDNLRVVKLLMQLVELGQEIEHVYDVEQNFEDERVVLHGAILLEEVDACGQDVRVLRITLQQFVVV